MLAEQLGTCALVQECDDVHVSVTMKPGGQLCSVLTNRRVPVPRHEAVHPGKLVRSVSAWMPGGQCMRPASQRHNNINRRVPVPCHEAVHMYTCALRQTVRNVSGMYGPRQPCRAYGYSRGSMHEAIITKTQQHQQCVGDCTSCSNTVTGSS